MKKFFQLLLKKIFNLFFNSKSESNKNARTNHIGKVKAGNNSNVIINQSNDNK